MKHKQSLRIAVAMIVAVAVATVSGAGLPTQAQVLPQAELPPVATPEAASTPEPTDSARPQKADLIVWTPNTPASFSLSTNPVVVVRVASTEGDFNLGTAKYFLLDGNGTLQPAQNASVTPISGNNTVDLSANLTNVPNGWKVVFQIYTVGGTLAESPVHNLTRATNSYLPLAHRNAGASVIPKIITVAGTNACDSLNSRKGGPLGSYVNYTVQGTSTDSWFYTVNPNPGATIVVSLTSYASVQGQLQVYAEQAGCGLLTGLLGFGPNPNPIVTIGNVPQGNIYFRVVSSAGQPAPPVYNISWGYAGGSGPFEPNNNPCQATQLQPGALYTTFSDDQYDFFGMNITGTGQIQVLVQGFTIGLAQVQVRSPLKLGYFCPGNGADPVNSTNRIDPFGVVPAGGGDVLITVFIQMPGLYYIRTSLPANVAGNGQPYKITWNYVGGGIGGDTAGPLFTTNPNQPASCNPAVPNSGCQPDIAGNVNEGGTFTFYWFGMVNIPGGYDSLQMRIAAKSDLLGCPANVFPSDPSKVDPQGFGFNFGNVGTLASRGSITFRFNKHGGYAVAFRALRGGNTVFFDEKPIRVSCGFLNKTNTQFMKELGKPSFVPQGFVMNEPMRPLAVFTEDTKVDVAPHP